MENKLTPELIAKAKQAGSAEELLALAKENDIEFSEEEAKAYFEQFTKSGELSDDELDNVAGGGCYYDDGRLVVTCGYWCTRYTCKKCGSVGVSPQYINTRASCFCDASCKGCKYRTNKGMRMLCNHPENYKR